MNRALDLLVCAATLPELSAFGEPLDAGESDAGDSDAGGFARRGTVGFLLTGVGIPLALAQTLRAASTLSPARILNIGIAGAYPDSGLQIADVVAGTSETYGDVGFELPDPPGFRSVAESPWGAFYESPLPLKVFPEWAARARLGRGCTVNTCTGTAATGRRRAGQGGAIFETMEGAAVAQAGQMLGLPVGEIRAISNFAACRDMRPENIQLALARLREFFERSRI